MLLMLCACSKEGAETRQDVPVEPVEVTLMAVADVGPADDEQTDAPSAQADATRGEAYATRSMTTDAKLPDTYTIYTTTYNTDPANPEMTGNFTTGIPFTKRDGQYSWGATPALFWPLGGTLDFFAVATEPEAFARMDEPGQPGVPFDITRHMVWAERRNTDGVMIDVPDYDGSTEILYGVKNGQTQANGTVPMTFYHTQTCLEFNVRIADEALNGLLRLEGIVVDDIITGGQLTILTYPFMKATWNTDDSEAKDLTVPESDKDKDGNPIEVTTGAQTSRITILPQNQQRFHIRLRQRANTSSDWKTTSIQMTYDHIDIENKWEIGKKYVYNVTIGLHTVDLSPEVVPWDIETSDSSF